ncbi:uncharacterized protein NPIL_671861 [Nephila pilipes]|uniref:Uncharacterized protein n=1 Tax=Nephila pilipes TaxID=299642 RepID=A0A8X6TP91_NEPPI|nr:uncharacterized protein NPIL_671861 [Nephila pilipes]
MDDVLCRTQTLEEAKELQQQQLIAIIQNARLQLHKWCTNHPELSLSVNRNYTLSNLSETKILEVSWKPMEDYSSFRVKVELSTSEARHKKEHAIYFSKIVKSLRTS